MKRVKARTEHRRSEDPWREGATLLEGDGDEAALPASEADAAGLHAREDEDGRPGRGGPGTIPPPD